MAAGFKKVIDLVKKTGDRCIILDSDGEPAFVVIGLADYEKLLAGSNPINGLTEQEFLEKINRDIANWKASQEAQIDQWQSLESVIKEAKNRIIETKSSPEEPNSASEDKYYFEPIDE